MANLTKLEMIGVGLLGLGILLKIMLPSSTGFTFYMQRSTRYLQLDSAALYLFLTIGSVIIIIAALKRLN